MSEWMTATDLAEQLGISLKTVRRRAGSVVDGRRYEERAAQPSDGVHHKTKTLFRAVVLGRGEVVEFPNDIHAKPVARRPEALPNLDPAGKLRWSESRRNELVDVNNGLRRCIVALEQQVAELEENYRAAIKEKYRQGATNLLEAMLSALGGVDEDDMREILSEAVREHVQERQ